MAEENLNRTPTLAIERPARFFVGGWYDRYDYDGAIEEVRISDRQRDANWIRLQYENQKPTSSLVGTLVRAGNELRVSRERGDGWDQAGLLRGSNGIAAFSFCNVPIGGP